MLARRELSVAQLRARLVDREHPPEEIDRAIEQLLETKALDDDRVARAYAASALKIKNRGRLRIQRELHEMGIPPAVIARAVGDAFGDVDERGLIRRAIEKKLRGRRITDRAEYARVYQFLMRQGFSAAAVSTVLRGYRRGVDPLE